jgi:hypothetical protein
MEDGGGGEAQGVADLPPHKKNKKNKNNMCSEAKSRNDHANSVSPA